MTFSNYQPPNMAPSPSRFPSQNNIQNQAQPQNQTPKCSPSYITHQRRPAIIPPGVHLSPEDEQAVRMRTGYVNPLSQNELAFAVPKIHHNTRAHIHASKYNSPADIPMTDHKPQMTSRAAMKSRGWNEMSGDATREGEAWVKMQEQKEQEWRVKMREEKEKSFREGGNGLVGVAGPGGCMLISGGYGKRKASGGLEEDGSQWK